MGKIHGIIGRNGSGKTVLIKTICGFVHPDTGRVLVDGKIIGKDIDFPKNIGAIIEAPGFLPNASAYKNLEYLASLRRVIGKEEIRKAIEIVGLNPDDKKHVGKYSLGMKQRFIHILYANNVFHYHTSYVFFGVSAGLCFFKKTIVINTLKAVIKSDRTVFQTTVMV